MASHSKDILRETGVYAAHSPAPMLIATLFDDKALPLQCILTCLTLPLTFNRFLAISIATIVRF